MFKEVWQKIWGRALIILLFVFAVYSNFRIGVQNYNLNQRVRVEQDKVSQLQIDNKRLSLLLAYYSSSSYQDIEARQRLGMKMPGETVYTVKGLPTNEVKDNSNNSGNISTTLFQVSDQREEVSSTPNNFSKWLDYFQGKK